MTSVYKRYSISLYFQRLDDASEDVLSDPSGSNTVTYNYDFWYYFKFWALAFLLPLGVVCNVLIFVVFSSTKSLRNTTTGNYLIALAVADITFLFGEFLR